RRSSGKIEGVSSEMLPVPSFVKWSNNDLTHQEDHAKGPTLGRTSNFLPALRSLWNCRGSEVSSSKLLSTLAAGVLYRRNCTSFPLNRTPSTRPAPPGASHHGLCWVADTAFPFRNGTPGRISLHHRKIRVPAIPVGGRVRA